MELPDQIKPLLPLWKCRALNTGPPGKSLRFFIDYFHRQRDPEVNIFGGMLSLLHMIRKRGTRSRRGFWGGVPTKFCVFYFPKFWKPSHLLSPVIGVSLEKQAPSYWVPFIMTSLCSPVLHISRQPGTLHIQIWYGPSQKESEFPCHFCGIEPKLKVWSLPVASVSCLIFFPLASTWLLSSSPALSCTLLLQDFYMCCSF